MSTASKAVAEPLTRGRRALFTVIYLVVLGLFLLLGVEVISRFVFPPQMVSVYITNEIAYDPVVGWRGSRDFSAAVSHGKHPVPIQVDINADGFRDESWDAKLARAQARGAKKILILGDSLLYGWSNPVDGRLSEQLLARYQTDQGNVEVFNAGIPAYGPHNELRLLPELLARLHPHEVVLLFCGNDYGNAALPYYLNPSRIYQPFYDTEARLLFNASVPRRPSLAMRDTFLGGLHLWYAADELRYAIEDYNYARRGIPNARTAPVHEFEYLLGSPALRARFPYVMATVLSEYALMTELSRTAGARFTFFSSIENAGPSYERVDDLLGAKLEERGIPFLRVPHDGFTYGIRWGGTLLDGHPNFLWAWILANGLYAHLEGKPYRLDFSQMPHTRDIPTDIDLGHEAASVRFLSMDWQPAAGGERRMTGPASIFLRRPAPGASQLEIIGWAPQPTRIIALGVEDRELCRFELTLPVAAYNCPIAADAAGPIVFVHLLPESPLDPGRLPVIRRVSVKTLNTSQGRTPAGS
jgi:hypothetical protein